MRIYCKIIEFYALGHELSVQSSFSLRNECILVIFSSLLTLIEAFCKKQTFLVHLKTKELKKELQPLTFEKNYSALVLSLTFYFVIPDLANADQDCLSNCNSKQGKCKFCGTEGYCCKKGSTPGNGCDGSFGGKHTLISVGSFVQLQNGHVSR